MKNTMSKRSQLLGDYGEELINNLLLENKFTNIKDLNKPIRGQRFADFYAERDGNRYVISVKTRNKLEITGVLNSRYKLGQNPEKVQESLDIIKKEFKDAIPAWIAIQIKKESFSAYFGTINDLERITGQIGGIRMHEKYLQQYEILGENLPHLPHFEYESVKNI